MIKWIPFAIVLLAAYALAQESVFNIPDELSDWDKPVSELVPQVSSRGGDIEFLYNLSRAFLREGRAAEAKDYIARAAKIDGGKAQIYDIYGDVYRTLGRNDSARVMWEKAVELAYEDIPVWNKLVSVAPEYYVNLGLLYRDKAKKLKDGELAQKAKDNLEKYINLYPDGDLVSQAKSAMNEMDIILSQQESKNKIKSDKDWSELLRTQRAMDIQRMRERFRTENPYLVGVSFQMFDPSKKIEFKVKQSKLDEQHARGSGIKDSVIQMDYYSTSLSEIALGGGYVFNEWFFRGALLLGNSHVGKSFTIDSTILRINPIDSVRSDTVWSYDNREISALRTIRVSGEVLYNYFFMDPLILYLSAGFDAGTIWPQTKDDFYESQFLAGATIGTGVMLHISPVLVDVTYRIGVLGSSTGSTIGIGGMFKF